MAVIIKRLTKKAGLPTPQLSGHSLRSGFVTEAKKNGAASHHGSDRAHEARDGAWIQPHEEEVAEAGEREAWALSVTGYVIADASSVYHELYRNEPGIIEVSCWAHARRYLYEALAADRERALVGIGFIGLLYDAHDAATDLSTGITDTQKRRVAAEPILKRLYRWVEQERPKLGDESPVAKAMNYLVNHRESLSRFLEDGRLRLGRVARWRGGCRLPVASARPFGTRASVRLAVTPSPAGSRRTGRAVLPHPALIESITPSRSAVSCQAPPAYRGRVAHTASRRNTGGTPCLAVCACA